MQCKWNLKTQGKEVNISPREQYFFTEHPNLKIIVVEIGSWRDRNLKIWPTNCDLEVDDLEKKMKNLARLKLRSRQLPISF